MSEQSDIIERLNDHCVGHPYAKIEWPHRLLHDARDEIETLRAKLTIAREALESYADRSNYDYPEIGGWARAERALEEINQEASS